MIIKGKSRGNGAQLGKYLVTQGKNEHIRVIEVRGVVAEDVPGAVYEMDALSLGARTEKGLYHAQINARAEERLTDEQWAIAVDRLEDKLGLTGQPRVVVVHEKEGREHCHVVWSRIDLDRMAAISDSNNYRKHEEVARSLEKEFGHERVQGAHIEREGKERPARTPSHSEMLQADRTGVSPAAARALMTELWRETGNGQEFKQALEEKWWVLARGDRRDFVAIDSAGGSHSITRRIDGAKAADVRERFADIDPASLPSVAEAKKLQRDRQDERWVQAAMETDRSGVHPKAATASMTALWNASHNGKTFQASLEQKWWVLARGDRGGFVAIDSAGGMHNLAQRIQGATGADIRQRFADIDPRSLPSVAEARKLQQERQAERTQRAGASAAGQARPDAGHARASVKPSERAAPVSGKAGAVASRLAGSVFSALMGETPAPKEKESEASPDTKSEGMPSQHRQDLMRQLSREIPQETERDAGYEVDKGRERSRG